MSVGTREANLNHNEIAPAVDVFLSTIPSMDWCKGKLGKPRYFRGKQWFPLRFPLNQFILYRAWLKIDDPILRWFSSDQTTGPYRPNPHLLFPKEPHNDASILMDTNMANISIFFVFFLASPATSAAFSVSRQGSASRKVAAVFLRPPEPQRWQLREGPSAALAASARLPLDAAHGADGEISLVTLGGGGHHRTRLHSWHMYT